jgi:hypothetical protein
MEEEEEEEDEEDKEQARGPNLFQERIESNIN